MNAAKVVIERERENGNLYDVVVTVYIWIYFIYKYASKCLVWFACLFVGELFVRLDSHCQSLSMMAWSSAIVLFSTSDNGSAYAMCIFRMNRGGEMLFGAFVHQPKLLGCRHRRRLCFHCLAFYPRRSCFHRFSKRIKRWMNFYLYS